MALELERSWICDVQILVYSEYGYNFLDPALSNLLDLGQSDPGVGATQSFRVALIRLMEVDDVPNSVEVLDRAS